MAVYLEESVKTPFCIIVWSRCGDSPLVRSYTIYNKGNLEAEVELALDAPRDQEIAANRRQWCAWQICLSENSSRPNRIKKIQTLLSHVFYFY
jgi:hypothetical protein